MQNQGGSSPTLGEAAGSDDSRSPSPQTPRRRTVDPGCTCRRMPPNPSSADFRRHSTVSSRRSARRRAMCIGWFVFFMETPCPHTVMADVTLAVRKRHFIMLALRRRHATGTWAAARDTCRIPSAPRSTPAPRNPTHEMMHAHPKHEVSECLGPGRDPLPEATHTSSRQGPDWSQRCSSACSSQEKPAVSIPRTTDTRPKSIHQRIQSGCTGSGGRFFRNRPIVWRLPIEVLGNQIDILLPRPGHCGRNQAD